MTFKEWLCNEIFEKDMEPGITTIYFPFFPLHDHGVEVTVKKIAGNKVRIDDNGETIGTLFSNGYLIKKNITGSIGKILGTPSMYKKQDWYIRHALELHGVHAGDDDVLWVECDAEDTHRCVMNLVLAIIQIYSVSNTRRE
jgi:hypothetical protein